MVLERDNDLPRDAIVTCGECAVGNDAVAIWCVVLQHFVDSLSNAGVVPAARTVCATTNDLSYQNHKHHMVKHGHVNTNLLS